MKLVVEHLIPRLGDSIDLANRQGAMKLIASKCDSFLSVDLAQTRHFTSDRASP